MKQLWHAVVEELRETNRNLSTDREMFAGMCSDMHSEAYDSLLVWLPELGEVRSSIAEVVTSVDRFRAAMARLVDRAEANFEEAGDGGTDPPAA